MDSVQAERDALAALTARCADAEQQVSELTAELAAARARITELEAVATEPISIFTAADTEVGDGLAEDGSDPRVLSWILIATAIVAGMVSVLALLNGNLFTPFGFAMVLIALGLAYYASRTRAQVSEISVSNGVVYVQKGESSYRFDVKHPGTGIDMVGQPGDPSWQVFFHRKGMDDFVVDSHMVEPHGFVRQLREFRPEL